LTNLRFEFGATPHPDPPPPQPVERRAFFRTPFGGGSALGGQEFGARPSVRVDDLNARLPGLLDAIVAAARAGAKVLEKQ
jgi:hypothetical protein